jgi:hypothetical protein
MSRKRAIVDNAPSSRLLHLHQADCLLRTEERSSKIHAHDSRPLVVTQIFDCNSWSVHASVVKENIQPAEFSASPHKERAYSIGLANVGGHRKHLADCVIGHRRCLFEIRNAATG